MLVLFWLSLVVTHKSKKICVILLIFLLLLLFLMKAEEIQVILLMVLLLLLLLLLRLLILMDVIIFAEIDRNLFFRNSKDTGWTLLGRKLIFFLFDLLKALVFLLLLQGYMALKFLIFGFIFSFIFFIKFIRSLTLLLLQLTRQLDICLLGITHP
jgi:hypothetical protein